MAHKSLFHIIKKLANYRQVNWFAFVLFKSLLKKYWEYIYEVLQHINISLRSLFYKSPLDILHINFKLICIETIKLFILDRAGYSGEIYLRAEVISNLSLVLMVLLLLLAEWDASTVLSNSAKDAVILASIILSKTLNFSQALRSEGGSVNLDKGAKSVEANCLVV